MEKQLTNVSDIDGNLYQTVKIGSQVWMAENLKTTRYNDGSEIPFVLDTAQAWYDLNAPGYCWYGDDEINKESVGALYNWHALNTGKLCPKGWRIPTDKDWTILSDFLGGEHVAGGKMKETGNDNWFTPNTGATNESGFTGISAGFRGKSGFIPLSVGIALFWTSSAFDELDGWTRYLLFDSQALGRNNGGKYHGFSIRCLKDE